MLAAKWNPTTSCDSWCKWTSFEYAYKVELWGYIPTSWIVGHLDSKSTLHRREEPCFVCLEFSRVSSFLLCCSKTDDALRSFRPKSFKQCRLGLHWDDRPLYACCSRQLYCFESWHDISQRHRGIYTPLGLKFWTDLGMSAQLFLMPQKDSVLAGMLNNEDLCIALAHNEMQLSLSEAESHVDSLLDIVSWWSERVNWDISVSERLNKP